MSAQAIDLGQLVGSSTSKKEIAETERAGDSAVVVSGVPCEVIYQALFAPEPSPEDILREQYLLECD